ncbi:hypothetical protein LDENG_00011550 [Lucifuga dentata]|nr:hypothetical protein LDENG_00011550 [Lucifuga dentata]
MPWLHPTLAIATSSCLEFSTNSFTDFNSFTTLLPRSCICTKSAAHVTPLLIQLHWLPVPYRIDFRILLLTFKALHNLAPTYLMDLLQTYTPSCSL